MKKIALGSRLLLGLMFFVFGLNGFLQFLPMPPMPEPAGQFLGALFQSGYLLQLVKALEVLSGLLLLLNFQVPLVLLVLSPIVVNIFLFHFFFTGAMSAIFGIPMVIVVLMIIVARDRFDHFRPIFAKN